MVTAAKRNDELVARFAPERRVLREPKMVSIGRFPSTDQTWLLGHESHMSLVPQPTWHRPREQRLVDAIGGLPARGCLRSSLRRTRLIRFSRRRGRDDYFLIDASRPLDFRLKCFLNNPSIGGR
jgi:hypothetical protein